VALAVLSVSAANAGEPAPTPAPDAVDPDVLRKVRKLIADTLSTENEAREAAWKGLKEMSNLAVPGLVALNRQKDTTPDMQRSIVIALGDTKDPRAGPALVELLASKDARLRRDAARSLGDSGYRDAVPALEKLAGTAAEPEDVRLHAAVAAARMESVEALKVLAELAKSQQAETRSRAIFALGKHGGVKQAPVIAQALTDADRDVREDAVAALRHIEKKDAWGPLVQATADSDYKVRAAAMDALREITGEKIGNDSAAWKAWWAEQKDKPEKAKE
jgi:HEAT repeat protein